MNTDDPHPVDEALRRLVGEPEPSAEAFDLAAKRLAESIAAESKPGFSSLRQLLLSVGVIAAMIAIVLTVGLLRPTPTEAAIEEIAAAAERSQPLVVPDGSFAYTASELISLTAVPREGLGGVTYSKDTLVYLLPTTRETWIGADRTVQLRTLTHTPTFFSSEDSATYYSAELDDQDRVGEVVTDVVTVEEPQEQWPLDMEALDRAITSAAAGRPRPASVEYLDVALDVIREEITIPQQRANLLRLIKSLPDLRVEEASSLGRPTFSIEYIDQGIRTRFMFMLSAQGFLLHEELVTLEPHTALGIPANTPILVASYSEPRLVHTLETP